MTPGALADGWVTDFVGPEHDAPPDHCPTEPRRSYVVCSTPRSGSGLLCRGLGTTGSLGTPLEYFNPVHRRIFSERWGCGARLQPYVDALHAHRTTPAGVFGLKLHWAQLVAVRAEANAGSGMEAVFETPASFIDRLLPSARFVRILRLDRDSQAVSYWRALHSNQWSLGAEDPKPLVAEAAAYDFDGIDRCRRLIDTAELSWDRLLRSHRVNPMIVTYGELVTGYAATILRVVGDLGGELLIPIPAPRTRRLSDEHSGELLARYRRDRRRRR